MQYGLTYQTEMKVLNVQIELKIWIQAVLYSNLCYLNKVSLFDTLYSSAFSQQKKNNIFQGKWSVEGFYIFNDYKDVHILSS